MPCAVAACSGTRSRRPASLIRSISSSSSGTPGHEVSAEAVRCAPGVSRSDAGAAGRYRSRGAHGDRGARRDARHRRRDVRRHAAAPGADAQCARPGARRRGKRRDRAHRAGRRPGRVRAHHQGRSRRSRRRSSRTRTRRRSSGRSPRSIPAATPSTACCSPRDQAGRQQATRRARSTSPTWWRSCAATVIRAGTVLAADPAEIQGVNDRVQLAQVRRGVQRSAARGVDEGRGHDHGPGGHLD